MTKQLYYVTFRYGRENRFQTTVKINATSDLNAKVIFYQHYQPYCEITEIVKVDSVSESDRTPYEKIAKSYVYDERK